MPYLAQKLKTKKTTEVKLQNLKKDNFIETRNIRDSANLTLKSVMKETNFSEMK